MISGHYRYEIRKGGKLVGVEEAEFQPGLLKGSRVSADRANVHEVVAHLDSENFIRQLELRYQRGPFSRGASYEVETELLRGHVSALSGRNAVETRLGRYREIDGDLLLFKAIIIDHIRMRGQTRWTGRVAMVDPSTLIVTSPKQSYQQRDTSGMEWIFEPLIGEKDSLELDSSGVLIRHIGARGVSELVLIARR